MVPPFSDDRWASLGALPEAASAYPSSGDKSTKLDKTWLGRHRVDAGYGLGQEAPAGSFGPDGGRGARVLRRTAAERADGFLVHPDAESRAVAEHEGAVLDGVVRRQADRRAQVLQLARDVVGHRGRRVQQAGGRGADRADRQVVRVGEG